MNYDEFVEKVANDLPSYLSKDRSNYIIEPIDVQKVQNSYHGISIRLKSNELAAGPSVDLGMFYSNFESGALYETVLKEIAKQVKKAIDQCPMEEIGNLMNYEWAKKHLTLELISTSLNGELLATVPHKEFEDLSIIYRVNLGADRNGDAISSAIVNNNLLKTFGITAEELHKDAIENAPIEYPAKLCSMTQFIADSMGIDKEDVPEDPENSGFYIGTCNDKLYGASCILYPGFLDEVSELVEGNFFIIPSSIHEVLFCIDDGRVTADYLSSIVHDVNISMIEKDEILSDTVYHYDAEKKIFETADSYNERMKEGNLEDDYEM